MASGCEDKQKQVIALFSGCTSAREKYEKIIELGKNVQPLDPRNKTETNRVRGCQSKMYLKTEYRDGKLFFETSADALISQGLGVLLTSVYSGESPETILQCPPHHIEELSLAKILSPTRTNGLSALYLRMKQEAVIAIQKRDQSPRTE
jgi:cysteine desulfuration protein SufE